jgi:hypothetical protein
MSIDGRKGGFVVGASFPNLKERNLAGNVLSVYGKACSGEDGLFFGDWVILQNALYFFPVAVVDA